MDAVPVERFYAPLLARLRRGFHERSKTENSIHAFFYLQARERDPGRIPRSFPEPGRVVECEREWRRCNQSSYH